LRPGFERPGRRSTTRRRTTRKRKKRMKMKRRRRRKKKSWMMRRRKRKLFGSLCSLGSPRSPVRFQDIEQRPDSVPGWRQLQEPPHGSLLLQGPGRCSHHCSP